MKHFKLCRSTKTRPCWRTDGEPHCIAVKYCLQYWLHFWVLEVHVNTETESIDLHLATSILQLCSDVALQTLKKPEVYDVIISVLLAIGTLRQRHRDRRHQSLWHLAILVSCKLERVVQMGTELTAWCSCNNVFQGEQFQGERGENSVRMSLSTNNVRVLKLFWSLNISLDF